MKKKLLSFVALSFLIQSQITGNINAYLSYSVFNTPHNKPYIETYLAVNSGSIVQVLGEDGFYQGTVDVQIIFRKNDSIVNFDKYELKGPKLQDTAQNFINYIDIERYALSNGTFQLELTIKDQNSGKDPVVSIGEFTIDFPKDSIRFSDTELLQKYSKDTTSSIMVKNGFELIPYIYNYYPEDVTTLNFYAELYNSEKTIGDGLFLLTYYIRPFEVDTKLNDFSSVKKTQTKNVNIMLNSIDISKLPSGNYLLVLEARDRNNNLLTSKETFFQRFNSKADNEVVNIAAIDVANSFVAAIPEDSLKIYIDYLYPISTNAEKTFVKANSKISDYSTLQQFFLGFWTQRNPVNPEGAWKDYKARVDQANYNFSALKIPGYTTDRGRVYLQYGQPNTISDSFNEPAAYPYSIWHYYEMEGQKDVKFVFCSRDVSTNDFKLIHSTAIGEVQNYQWQHVIFERTWPWESVDQTVAPPSWGSNVNTYYLYPR